MKLPEGIGFTAEGELEVRPLFGSYAARSDGKILNIAKGTVMKCSPHNAGYRTVGLSVKGKARTHLVHRLIARAFLGPCPDLCNVNHKDGNKANNAVSNLEYVTYARNAQHSREIGLKDNLGNNKLTWEQVREIRKLLRLSEYHLKKAKTHGEIAEMVGVSRSAISMISRGAAWKDFYDKMDAERYRNQRAKSSMGRKR